MIAEVVQDCVVYFHFSSNRQFRIGNEDSILYYFCNQQSAINNQQSAIKIPFLGNKL